MPESSKSAAETPEKLSLQQRVWNEYQANRRRIGTVAAVLFALFLTWHAVNGRNGLSSWQQKRAEDKALAQEIDRLTAENARLGQHVEHLKSDPEAIEREARVKLHYAKAGEVIVALPPENSQTQSAPAGK